MRSIIVPVDGSPQSIQALRYAISLAKAFGDELVLLSVHSSSQILGENMLQEAVSIAGQESVPYRTKVRVGGNPTIEINFEANDPNVRCVVMGLSWQRQRRRPGQNAGQRQSGAVAARDASDHVCAVYPSSTVTRQMKYPLSLALSGLTGIFLKKCVYLCFGLYL
jgi:nucleotide-binding universal stress UspA family protein